MRVITVNVNGIRAAERKGFFVWLAQQHADFICLQETKAQSHQLTADAFWPTGYHCTYCDAQKKGYSGVALYSQQQPDQIIKTIGWSEADQEGRFIEARIGKLSIISLYLPSGSSSAERQTIKFNFLDQFMPLLEQYQQDDRHYIICGDWNIAHKKIDLKNWRGNQKNSGFLPEERAWMDQLLEQQNWIDSFRSINQQADQYTWWSNRGQAWANNVGWRIDYQILSPNMAGIVSHASIYKQQRFSDHAPLIIDYNYPLN